MRLSQACLQFYGRGLFARPPITWAGGPYSKGLQGHVRKAGLGTVTLLLSMLDQPLRLVSAGLYTAFFILKRHLLGPVIQ